MAFDKKPSTWLGAGYAASSGAHTITLNTNDASSDKTLSQLVDSNADPTTGDIRILAFALMEALYAGWVAQIGSQPTKFKVTRQSKANSNGTITFTYHVSLVLVPGGTFTVEAE